MQFEEYCSGAGFLILGIPDVLGLVILCWCVAVQCIMGYSAASMHSTHWKPAASSEFHKTKISANIAKVLWGQNHPWLSITILEDLLGQ